MFDVQALIFLVFDVQVVGFGVQAVKVLLTAFSLQAKQPDLLSTASSLTKNGLPNSPYWRDIVHVVPHITPIWGIL
jgi:hypothetical protein